MKEGYMEKTGPRVRVFTKYSEKKWVIDGGSLQVIDPEVLRKLSTTPILTPHTLEYEKLFGQKPIEVPLNIWRLQPSKRDIS